MMHVLLLPATGKQYAVLQCLKSRTTQQCLKSRLTGNCQLSMMHALLLLICPMGQMARNQKLQHSKLIADGRIRSKLTPRPAYGGQDTISSIDALQHSRSHSQLQIVMQTAFSAGFANLTAADTAVRLLFLLASPSPSSTYCSS